MIPRPVQIAPATVADNNILGIASSANAWALIVNANIDPAAAIVNTKLAPGAADTVLNTNGAGTATQWAKLINANIDAAAAIAGTKITPAFGAQNVSTGGSLTVSSLGLGIVHSSGGGLFSSSTIVDADVNAAAAIAVSKLAAGTNGFVLQTTAGVPTWALLPAASVSPGAANTVLVTNAGATATTFATIVNANVNAAAAIDGSKINPNFGAQDVTTTGNYTGARIILGTNPALTGTVRLPNTISMNFRNAGNTVDLNMMSGSGTVITIGQGTTVTVVQVASATSFQYARAGAVSFEITSTALNITGPSSIDWSRTTTNPTIMQEPAIAGTAQDMWMHAQSFSGGGASGGLFLTDGVPSGGSLPGGLVLAHNVDDTKANVFHMLQISQVISGNHIIALARGSAITTTQMPANTGDRVVYLANAATVPTANPVSGGIQYATGGACTWRGTSGTVTTMGLA